MALEVTSSFTLAFDDGTESDALSLAAVTRTATTPKYLRHMQTVGITEEALLLGECTAPLEVGIKNLDPTNFVYVKSGTGGLRIAKIFPGKGMMVPLGPDMQVPYVIADTNPVKIAIFVCNT